MPVLALPPLDPGFEIVLSSQGMSQGISQTEGIQIIPRAFLRLGATQIGAQWRNISSPSAKGVLAFFLRHSRRFANGQIDAGIVYRIRTGATSASNTEAWEFTAAGRRDFGRLGLRVGVDYSPQDFESGGSLYIELGSSFDVGRATRVSANIGRRERKGPADYTAYNLGIATTLDQRVSLDARYYWSNRVDLGARYQGRLVISARLAF